MRAAHNVAAQVGFGGLTVDVVAVEARVSRLTVYNHFESKAGLLEALAWSIFAKSGALLAGMAASLLNT